MRKTLMRPGGLPESSSSPVVTPLMPSVVYAAEGPDALDALYEGRAPGYSYAREGHPNADVLGRRLATLEALPDGVVTGSGMAAVTAALLGVLRAGDHVVGGDQLYGRSLRMLREDLPRLGIAVDFADPTSAEHVAAALRPETRMVLIEVVSNPTLRIADLSGIAELCRDRGILLAVDNTFTTPAAIRPAEHGADIVIQSVTKLLAGHSDVTLGWVGARDAGLTDAMRGFAVTTGLTPSPFDCWLGERGLMTFGLRYARAEATAARLADALADRPGLARVIYPTRPDHPDARRSQSLLAGHGGHMLSFEIEGGRPAADAFARAAEGIAFAPTLGDVGSTLSHPASSSHRGLTAAARAALGMSEGFFRLSVGLEEPEALEAVLLEGLAAARAA
ncbi:trans-sulfuration enzyme family protein [Roseivivax sp. CAU 1761]